MLNTPPLSSLICLALVEISAPARYLLSSRRNLSSSKGPEKETERLPGPDEVYATSIFGAGRPAEQDGEKAVRLVVGE